MISKELLSKVLEDGILKVQQADNTRLAYWNIYNSNHSIINVNDLANKLKVFAFDNYGVYISSGLGEDSSNVKFWTANFKINGEFKSFWSEIEFDAICKACEWILTKDSK